MTANPFIEAEEVAGHSVNNACRLLEVSHSAYYQRRQTTPSARATSDAELTEKITAIHTESKGTYGTVNRPGFDGGSFALISRNYSGLSNTW